ncbi:MAG TPA: hypothetical protein VLE45_17095, partial [Burkholderiaceae bacterium]|nr:hypothetical protein [Burkholderiaceae bacterium]
ARQAAARHHAGACVGRFELLDVLGRGAQAEVWRANDRRLDREVALKLLLPGAQGISAQQWLHEARAVSRLAHIARRPPQWLQCTADARTSLPLTMRGATFGLIYADRAQPGSIAAGEKELSLLHTLRSQAVMAFRQAA